MKKEVGIIGLGKMGHGVALQLLEKGWHVVGYNRSREKTDEYVKNGLDPAYSLQELVQKLEAPRVIWIMLTAGQAVEDTLWLEQGLMAYLEKGDIIVEAGNSYYKDTIKRAEKIEKHVIKFIDAGVSGGPEGARHGACIMAGGEKGLYEYLLPLFKDIARPDAVGHFEGIGAGHFVKMVHNGIEYGMMQAIGEGFEVLKKSDYNLDLQEVTRIYDNGSVIESRLINWLQKAYQESGVELTGISGSVNSTGEGEWTVKTAKEMGIPVKVIEDSFQFRLQSQENPSYTGKVVSALRNQFGRHDVKEVK